MKHGYAVSLVWDDMTGMKTITVFGTKFCALILIRARWQRIIAIVIIKMQSALFALIP